MKIIIIIFLLLTLTAHSQEQTTVVTKDVTVNTQKVVNYKDYSIKYITVKTETEVESFEVETIEYYNDYREININETPTYKDSYRTLEKIENFNYRLNIPKYQKSKEKLKKD